MIKVEIRKETPDKKGVANINASGNVPELLSDTAMMVNGIYRQLAAVNPELAMAFRYGLVNMAIDPESPMWGNTGDQIGFAIKTN